MRSEAEYIAMTRAALAGAELRESMEAGAKAMTTDSAKPRGKWKSLLARKQLALVRPLLQQIAGNCDFIEVHESASKGRFTVQIKP